MATTQILYALVARQVNVLAEHQTPQVPYELPVATRLVLQRLPSEDKRHSLEFDREYLFVCIVEAGITFLCLCRKDAEMRRVFGFLDDIKGTVIKNISSKHPGNKHSLLRIISSWVNFGRRRIPLTPSP